MKSRSQPLYIGAKRNVQSTAAQAGINIGLDGVCNDQIRFFLFEQLIICMNQFGICGGIDSAAINVYIDTPHSQCHKILFMTDKRHSQDHFVFFCQIFYQFSSKPPQHIGMIGQDDNLFSLLIVSRSAFHNAFMFENGSNGSKKAFHIKEKALFLHIFSVIARLFCDFQLISAVNLRPAGESRPNIIGTVCIARSDQIFLIPQRGPRSDDAHISHKNIPNLRQFVQAVFSQKSPDTGEILLRILQQMRRHIMRRIHFHAAKFMQRKVCFIFSHTLLCEQNRSRIVQIYGSGNHSINRCQCK